MSISQVEAARIMYAADKCSSAALVWQANTNKQTMAGYKAAKQAFADLIATLTQDNGE